MKKRFFILFITLILTSCTSVAHLPQATPSKEQIQTIAIPTTLPKSLTSTPMMFKIAELGRGFIFDHAFSPDGKILAIGSSSGVYVYDAKAGDIIRQISSDISEDVLKVVFSPNGKFLAYEATGAKFYAQINVVEVQTGNAVIKSEIMPRTNHIIFSQDNKYLAFIPASYIPRENCSSSVEIWDIRKSKKVISLAAPSDYPYDPEKPCFLLQRVAFNQDNSEVFAGFAGGLVAWNLTTGQELYYTAAYSGYITDMFYDPTMSIVVTGDSGGAVRYWDAKTGTILRTIGVSAKNITSIGLSADKEQLLVKSKDHPTVTVDYKSGRLIGSAKDLSVDQDFLSLESKLYNDGFFSINGSEYFYGAYTRDRKIVYDASGVLLATGCPILDAKTGKTISVLSSCNMGDWDREMVYSPTGRYIAQGNSYLAEASNGNYRYEGDLKLWEAATGDLILDEQLDGGINALAISSDEHMLAVGTNYVSLWNVQTKNRIRNFYPGSGRVEYVGFRNDDLTLMVVTVPNYLISLFDIKNEKLLSFIRPPLPDNIYPYGNVYFHDNMMAAEGTVWKVESDSSKILLNNTYQYDQLAAFSPDGRVFVAQNYEGLNFWDIKSNTKIYTFKSDLNDINPVFSPDGTHIAFISPGGYIQVWDVSHIVEKASP